MYKKIKVTQDFLYEYLTEHNINLVTLAELMGVNHPMVYSCFRHNADRFGHPRNFTEGGLLKLNSALPVLADRIKQSIITFGTEQMFTNRLGRTYDPGLVPLLRDLSKYFNMNAMTKRVLGWSVPKKQGVLCSPASKVYGLISSDDITKVNTELLSVSSFLDNIIVTV